MKKMYSIMTRSILVYFVIVNIANASEPKTRIPMIGETAPSFVAQTTKGEIKFPEDYWNKWVVLFCHPSDFTPVCTSELMTFAEMNDEFEELNCKLIGLSTDGLSSHTQWIKEIKGIEFNGMKNVEINYPIIADKYFDVSKKYGMIHPDAHSSKTVRGVFIIDDNQKIQAVLLYPMLTGRSIEEIVRLVKALQAVDERDVATPEGWQPGDSFLLRPASSSELAIERYNERGGDYDCPAWFFCIEK